MIVFKYGVNANGENNLWVPEGTKFLSMQAQNNKLCIWAMHDPNIKKFEGRVIAVYGTGIEIPPGGELKYINTCLCHDDALVFHAFERNNFWKI